MNPYDVVVLSIFVFILSAIHSVVYSSVYLGIFSSPEPGFHGLLTVVVIVVDALAAFVGFLNFMVWLGNEADAWDRRERAKEPRYEASVDEPPDGRVARRVVGGAQPWVVETTSSPSNEKAS